MEHLIEIPLSAPIILNVPTSMSGRRAVSSESPRQLVTFQSLQCWVKVNTVTRQIWVHFARLPQPLMIYDPADFAAACSDTPEQHGERVLQILGDAPGQTLQAICNGEDLPPAIARVPRSIRHWQIVNVLRETGLLERVEQMIANSEDHTLKDAWTGLEDLARQSPSVILMASALGLSDDQVDGMFIAAGGLTV